MVRDLSSVCVAVAVHASALIGAYLSSPSLVAAEPLAPEPGRTRLVLPPRADEDIALVGTHGVTDHAIWAWSPPFENLMTCRLASGGPAIFELPDAGVDAMGDARARLEGALDACVRDAYAYGAEVLVTVNRLPTGGGAAHALPLNDAGRDSGLLCCIKVAQEHVVSALRPGETRRYRLGGSDDVQLAMGQRKHQPSPR